MSSYNWNLRHGNVHGLAGAPPVPKRTEVACRVCDRVFTSTQALMNHIESHILDDGLTAARLRQLTRQNTCRNTRNSRNTRNNPSISSNPPVRPTPAFPLANPIHQRNPQGVKNQFGFAPLPPLPPLPPPPPPPPPPHHQYPYSQHPQVSQPYPIPRNVTMNPRAGSQNMMAPANQPVAPANQPVAMVEEEDYGGTSDRTRPFLSQLERPIQQPNYELNRHGNLCNASSEYLDLTLKLYLEP